MDNNIMGAFTEVIDPGLVWLLVKILFLFGVAIYLVFSMTIYRQTKLMDQVLKISIKPSFKTIAIFYFFTMVLYFLLALILL